MKNFSFFFQKNYFFVFTTILVFQICFVGNVNAQFQTKDKYSGDWDESLSWQGAYPTTDVSAGINKAINISGEILLGNLEENKNLTITSGKLIVVDTLVVYGDLILKESSDLEVKASGILIVMGNMSSVKHVAVAANGVLVVQGSYTVTINNGNGAGGAGFTSSGDPAQVYFGGGVNPPSIKKPYKDFPILDPDEHFKLSDLETNNPGVWPYFEAISKGATGGTIEIVDNSSSCSGGSLPSIVNNTEAWPAAYDEYSWEYSSASTGWTVTASSNIDMIFTTNFPEPNLPEGIYLFRRKAFKSNGSGDPKYSNEVTVTVRSSPAPIGIFF